MEGPTATLDLWDYRRRVTGMYRRVREAGADQAAWQEWRRARDELFGSHPQSALDPEQQSRFGGLEYFPYDPAWRFTATVEPLDGGETELGHSGAGATHSMAFGVARFFAGQELIRLPLYWLDDYGGGVFLPFRDATNGNATYGGGRYLLDTAKGADLGHDGSTVILDFNYAFHPSCAHNDRWSCPLAPPANTLDIAVRAGERLPEHPPPPTGEVPEGP